jgi:protein phosphatase 2C family protein 2/3
MILTIKRPKTYPSEKYWPNISYLALFDGHGGSSCGNFLRDNLHNYIIKENNFLENIEQSLINSFEKAENDFLKIAKENNDKSGSCALVCLIIDNYLYIANCGDSRAIISLNSGKEIKILNTIHRPYNKSEKNRILENGGRIYYSNNIMRIYPGRLSVSRAFGDKNAKFNELGEKKNVLISIPEICKINIKGNKIDFLIMGCDGIFDSLSNKDCVDCAWKIMNENKKNYSNFHELNGDIVDFIIKSALKRNTKDNVTTLFVSFRNFQKKFHEESLNHYFKYNDIYQSDEGSVNKSPNKKKKIFKLKSFNNHINEEVKNDISLNENISDENNNEKIMNNSTIRPIIRVK